jgi:hypothetical protein
MLNDIPNAAQRPESESSNTFVDCFFVLDTHVRVTTETGMHELGLAARCFVAAELCLFRH